MHQLTRRSCLILKNVPSNRFKESRNHYLLSIALVSHPVNLKQNYYFPKYLYKSSLIS